MMVFQIIARAAPRSEILETFGRAVSELVLLGNFGFPQFAAIATTSPELAGTDQIGVRVGCAAEYLHPSGAVSVAIAIEK